MVEHARNPAFTRPALTGQEHRRALARGEEFDLAPELGDGGRDAERLEPLVLVLARPQQRVLARQADPLTHPRRGGGEKVEVHGLREKGLGTELHRPHRGLDIALPREQDDRAALGADPLEHLEPVEVGQVEGEDREVGARPPEGLEPLLRRARPAHLVPERVEVLAQHAQYVRVVVDQQHAVSHGAPRAAPSPDRRSPAAPRERGAPRTAHPPTARRRAASAAAALRAPPRGRRGRARTRAGGRRCAVRASAPRTRSGWRACPRRAGPTHRATRHPGRRSRRAAGTAARARRSSRPAPSPPAARATPHPPSRGGAGSRPREARPAPAARRPPSSTPPSRPPPPGPSPPPPTPSRPPPPNHP